MVDKKVDIEKIDINSLVPADYNPRRISDTDYNNLKQSIDEFGIVSPILINLNDNTIISGHQRFDVLFYENNLQEVNLIKLGDIGWVFTDTDLKIKDKHHEKALNLALNRIHGEFDEEKLNEVLVELEELHLDNLTGFDLKLDDISYEFSSRITDEGVYEEEDDDEIIEEEVDFIEKDEPIEETIEEEIEYEEEPVEEVIKEEPIVKKENARIRKGFARYGDIYKIGESDYIMFGKEENGQDRTKLLNITPQKTPILPKGLKSIKKITKEINYYMSDDAEVIEDIIIKNKKIAKKIR